MHVVQCPITQPKTCWESFVPAGNFIWLKELENFLCQAFSKWKISLVSEKSLKTFWYQVIWKYWEKDSASCLNPSSFLWARKELVAISTHMSIFFLYRFLGEQLTVIFLFNVFSNALLVCFFLRWWHCWHPPPCSLSVLKIPCSFSSHSATFGTCRKRRCSLRWLDLNIANLLWILPNDFSQHPQIFLLIICFELPHFFPPLKLPSQKALLLRDGNNRC